jgi:hypothetical protein
MRIDRDCPSEQCEGFENPVLGYRIVGRKGAQVQIISVEAIGPLAPSALDLGLTKRRLNDASGADCDFVRSSKTSSNEPSKRSAHRCAASLERRGIAELDIAVLIEKAKLRRRARDAG